jgi:hypothetical protein
MSTAQSPRQEAGRNEAIRGFLTTKAEWLMWIDTDMVFERHSVRDLLWTARNNAGDIVAGLGFSFDQANGTMAPNGYRWNDHGFFEPIYEYQETPERVLDVDGVGSGFLLVNRRVYEKWTEYFGDELWHQTWPQHAASGTLMGHDLAFCFHAKEDLGMSILWDTYVKTGHIKHLALTEDNYNASRRT